MHHLPGPHAVGIHVAHAIIHRHVTHITGAHGHGAHVAIHGHIAHVAVIHIVHVVIIVRSHGRTHGVHHPADQVGSHAAHSTAATATGGHAATTHAHGQAGGSGQAEGHYQRQED